ncbi:MAG: hypothetical protein JRF27_02575 [Deltaproteobacteria bacterium]|nr:hypothetical protein [Deltaproteobacteria bacterium]
MSKINILGGVFFLAGLLVLGFQAISAMMTPDEIVWESWTTLDFVDAEYLTWIDEISYSFVVNALNRFIESPIYLICITLGILCLIVGFTTKKA